MTGISIAEYRAITRKPKVVRKPPRYLEAQYQASVVLWARARFEEDPNHFHDLDLLHCSLSGVPMTPAQAKRAKAQGMRPGIPDLCLPVPVGPYHGLYIEMKTEDGRLSEDQKDVTERLALNGYKVVVAYNPCEAKEAIRRYYNTETINGEQPAHR